MPFWWIDISLANSKREGADKHYGWAELPTIKVETGSTKEAAILAICQAQLEEGELIHTVHVSAPSETDVS